MAAAAGAGVARAHAAEVWTDAWALALCGVWAVVWFLIGSCGRGTHARRLWRSQLYCGAAGAGGAWLLWRLRGLPEDWVLDFSREHQALFSMAVGHWLVAILEDRGGQGVLGRWLAGRRPGGRRGTAALLGADALHHAVLAASLASLLLLRRLTILGTAALLFDLPSLLLGHRELSLRRAPAPAWTRSPEGVARFWSRAYFVSFAARGPPILAYLYTVVHAHPRLSPGDAVVYHATAAACIAWAWGSLHLMDAWRQSDLNMTRHSAEDDADDGAPAAPPTDPGAAPLVDVTPEDLACHGASDATMWAVVDGMVYDITGLVQGPSAPCPGCSEALRAVAGQDGSAGFHAAAHSERARAGMARFVVGRFVAPPTEYRLFEHREEEAASARVVVALSVGFLLQVVATRLLPPTTEPHPRSLVEASAPSAEVLLRALLVTAGAGGLATVCGLFLGSRSAVRASLMQGLAFAVGCVALEYGLLASLEAPEALPAPLSTELAAALLLAWYKAREPEERLDFDHSAGVVFAAGAVLASWAQRVDGAALLLDRAPTAAILAASLALMSHGACAPGLGRVVKGGGGGAGGAAWAQLAAGALPIVRTAGLYSAIAATALAQASPEAAGRVLGDLLDLPGGCAAAPLAMSASALAAFAGVACASRRCSPAFAARGGALLLAATCGVGLPASGLWGWLARLGFLCHLAALAARNREVLREAAAVSRFSAVPVHIVGNQAVWDRASAAVGTFIWRWILLSIKSLLDSGLPKEIHLFACEAPFPSVGTPEDRTYYGVTAYFAPKRAQEQRQMPQYFVCNVGQIFSGQIHDMQYTMNTLIDVWKEFQDPNTKGLLANVIAVFPDIEDQLVAKEINLSAWESPKDAHNWYVRSPGHKNALFQHSSGLLRAFGNLLASLEPGGPVRHHESCRRCGRRVESSSGVAATLCSVCGGKTMRYPIF